MSDAATQGAAQHDPAQTIMLAGGGEMGALMRAHDWSTTPLGPFEHWPQSLRTAVDIMINSRYPMFLFWGPELAKLYNDGYRPILGTKHPEALGRPGPEIWPEIWDTIGPMVERVIVQGESTWSDDLLLFMHRNGYFEEVYFTFSYSPIHDESGAVGGMFCACNETTGRVLGERRLRTLRDLAAQASATKTDVEACAIAAEILAHNPYDFPFALLYLIDADGRTASLSGTVGLAAGTPASPLAIELAPGSQAPWPLGGAIQCGQSMLLSDVQERLGALHVGPWPESPHTAAIVPIAAPGQLRPTGFLVAGISARRAYDDAYQGLLELVAAQVATAVSHARAYEEERRRAEALAELDRAKTTFFSNVSHEFRTPLSLLLGPLEDSLTDRGQPLPPRHQERLEVAYRNTQRLLKLVNTLLDFSRIEAGRVQACYEPYNLAALTRGLAGSFRSAIERAGLRLQVRIQPLDEPVYVDREMWEKIVLNLLSNAFKFTLSGTITVELRQVGAQAELAIGDTGVGIPPAELPRLFERFHRVEGTQGRTYEGSGIGLALVQELVRLHGGQIQVESRVGVGTTFTVRIPLGSGHLPAGQVSTAAAHPSTALTAMPFVEEALSWLPAEQPGPRQEPDGMAGEAGPPPVRVPMSGEESTPGPGRAHIVLVEDNRDMRAYVRRLLEPQYTVDACSNALEALACIRAQRTDLILCDIMLPGMDGFELLRSLRADPATTTLPVILLSARAGEESRIEGLEAGAHDYLVKPFSTRELLARVQSQLELAMVRQAAARREQQYADRMRLLAEATLVINSTLTLDAMLQQITEQARAIIGAHQAITSLTSDESWAQTISTISLSDKYEAWRDYQDNPSGEGIYTLVCRTNRPMRLTQAELEAHPAWHGFGDAAAQHPPMRGWLAAPLIRRDGKNIGLIQLSDKVEGEFSAEDEAVLVQLAQLAAVAIENANLYQDAQRALQSRDQFLAIAAHELKTPITSILGYAQLIERRSQLEGASQRDQRTITSLTEQVQRLHRLTASLLDLSRIQREQLTIEQQPLDLAPLLRRLADEFRSQTDKHTIEVECAEQPLTITGDAMRLEQVFSNLIKNAIKYSGGGLICIQLERRGQHAIVSISDQGIGIPERELPHIFTRFYRVDHDDPDHVAGLGLGLFVVKEIVNSHGGTIAVESQEGHGSTFRVTLGLDEPGAGDADAARQHAPRA